MKNIKEYATIHHVPIIQDEGLLFIIETINKRKIRRILELGTAIGYSSSQMALLDPSIEIDTIEKNEEMYHEALKNIEDAVLSHQITCHFMSIEDFKTTKSYDLIFIDAAKAQYGKYLQQFLPNLAKDGCVIFDNLEFHGMVENPSLAKSRATRQLVKKIKQFKETIVQDDRFISQYYPNIGDGILIIERKDN